MEFKENIYKPITYIHNHKPHICQFGNDKQKKRERLQKQAEFYGWKLLQDNKTKYCCVTEWVHCNKIMINLALCVQQQLILDVEQLN